MAVTEFDKRDTESDVEQKFLYQLLSLRSLLGINEGLIRTKDSISAVMIGKGNERKRYVPDYLVYCAGLPVLVGEAKKPAEQVGVGLREVQLYAHQINARFPANENPLKYLIASNGNEVVVAPWDGDTLLFECEAKELTVGSKKLNDLSRLIGFDALQSYAEKYKKATRPQQWHLGSDYLGQNRVALTKVGQNDLYFSLEPLLRRYFNPQSREAEDEIVRRAYVTTTERTKYERSFEMFLRDRIVPREDDRGVEIETDRRSAGRFQEQLAKQFGQNRPYMQLIIGGVGAGKTTFIRRFFRHVLSDNVRRSLVYFHLNFNILSDDIGSVSDWVCSQFIEHVRLHYRNLVDLSDPRDIERVFSVELDNNRGAYSFIKKSSEEKYNERKANDLLNWLDDPRVTAKALSRYLSGEKGLTVIVAFDNVDRRSRELQLEIFQAGQWFMNQTRSVCLMTLRDETYEAYKDEKPLDAFLKTGNFYIRAPRFVDMVQKRLDLAIAEAASESDDNTELNLEGLGRFVFPTNSLGTFLTSVYVDLFKRSRTVTLVLEGLSGKNARRALEMFSGVLTSAHFPTDQFTRAALSGGEAQIKETVLIRSLMRTNYLYFTNDHGFVRNIFSTLDSDGAGSHFIKYCILDWLITNRKRRGDINVEGFFTVLHLKGEFERRGFDRNLIQIALSELLRDELVGSDRSVVHDLRDDDALRVNSSGYIHAKILAGRMDYSSACALITPVKSREIAEKIGNQWQIGEGHIDPPVGRKIVAGDTFVTYLEALLDANEDGEEHSCDHLMVKSVRAGLDFKPDRFIGSQSHGLDRQRAQFDTIFDLEGDR